MVPLLTDLVTQAVGKQLQGTPSDFGKPARRDNLYAPREGGALRSSQSVCARKSSLALQAQKQRLGAAAPALVVCTAVAGV
jgi:hypothetical protein